MDPGGVRWKPYLEAGACLDPDRHLGLRDQLHDLPGHVVPPAHQAQRAAAGVDWRIEEDAVSGTLTLSLVNVGFGPAIIREIAVMIDGEPIPTDSLEACEEAARRIGRGDPGLWDLTCFVQPEEYVLRPSETVVIFASRPTSAHATEDHTKAVVDYRRLGASAR